jgi:hypothetical protein
MTAKTNLAQPTFNSLSWDAPLNSNFGILDNAIGGNLNLSITSANVTLTATQAQNAIISVTGLTATRSLATGANIVGTWVVSNASSFTLNVYTALSTGTFVSIPTNTIVTVYSPDGINMYEANNNTVKKTGDTMTGTLVLPSNGLTVGTTQLYVASGNVYTSGNFFATSNVTAYTSSDERLKDNIETLTDALDKVKSLRGVTFTTKKDGKPCVGVVAQELQHTFPELVTEGEDGYLYVAYANLVGVLINAVKELSARVDKLES